MLNEICTMKENILQMTLNRKICSFVVLILLCISYNTIKTHNVEEHGKTSIYSSVKDANSSAHILPKLFYEIKSLLVVIVHSQPSNLAARNSIRETWGDLSKTLKNNVTLWFLIGETTNSSLQHDVNMESDAFDDIIQEHFVDSSDNATLKSLMMLKIAKYCYNSSKYLLKVDDGVLANLDNIVQMLKRDGSPDLLMGYMADDATPETDLKSKLLMKVAHYLFPEKKYSHNISGAAYLMSLKVAKKLYEVALQTPLVHREEVYIMVICADKANVKPQHSALFSKTRFKLNRDECLLEKLFTVQDLNPENMRIIYYTLMDDWSEKCEEHCNLK